MYETEAARLEGLAQRLTELSACLDVEGSKDEIARLEQRMAEPGFWDDPDGAQKVLQKVKALKDLVETPVALGSELEEVRELVELARAEGDGSMDTEIAALADELEGKLRELEIRSLLSDTRDSKSVIVSIHPGAGGTESCDWASMLYRMLMRFCERRGFTTEVLDLQPGDEAGIKSVTFTVDGSFAYGYLKSEAGVHRLVRISPFDSNARRHTSFAAVEVITPVDKDIEITIPEDDLKVDVFRSSGPGGQKVNKTSSAVRLTHMPTGLVVACQVERSQHRNRAMALDMLKAKLYDIELKKQEAALDAQREDHQEVAWGSQIRSYVLQPYQMVKDHRTNVETGNIDRVLDGDLDLFVQAYLKWNLERKGKK